VSKVQRIAQKPSKKLSDAKHLGYLEEELGPAKDGDKRRAVKGGDHEEDEAIAQADAEVYRIMKQGANAAYEGDLVPCYSARHLDVRCCTAPLLGGSGNRGAETAGNAAAYGRSSGWVCYSAAAVRPAAQAPGDGISRQVAVDRGHSCTESHVTHYLTTLTTSDCPKTDSPMSMVVVTCGLGEVGSPAVTSERACQQVQHRHKSRAPLSPDAAQKAVVKPPASADMLTYSAGRRHTFVSVAGRHCASCRVVLDPVHMGPLVGARGCGGAAVVAGHKAHEEPQQQPGLGVQPLSSPRVLVLPPQSHGSRMTSLSAHHSPQQHHKQQQQQQQRGYGCQATLRNAGGEGAATTGPGLSHKSNSIRGCVLLQFGPPKPNVPALPSAALAASDAAVKAEWLSSSTGQLSSLQCFGTPRLLPAHMQGAVNGSSSSNCGQHSIMISSSSGYGGALCKPPVLGGDSTRAVRQQSQDRQYMQKSRPSKAEPHGPQDIDLSAPQLNGRKLSSPMLEDINYIVGRWSSR
jgi:hypothetical protein